MNELKLNFVWKVDTREYSNGESLYLNRFHIAGYSHNASMSRGETPEYKEAHRYSGSVLLLNLMDRRLYGKTPEDIKGKIEQLVTAWFNEALK